MTARILLLCTLALAALTAAPLDLVAEPAAAWGGPGNPCSQLNMYPGPLLQPVFDIVCQPGNLPP